MKRFIATVLALALSVSLTACAGTSSSSTTPKDYTQIIMDTRTDDLNESYAITAGQNGEQPTLSLDPNGTDEEQAKSMIEMQMSTLGLPTDDLATLGTYAYSLSLMNVQAYMVGIFKPASGSEETVRIALENYLSNLQRSFENYLPDQYEIAKNGTVKELSSGEIVIVVCEDSATVLKAIEDALK